MRRPRVTFLVSFVCLGWGLLTAQTSDVHRLPADPEIQELLKAIDAYQGAAASGTGYVDPAYLIQSLQQLETRLSKQSNPSEADALTLPLLYFRINQNARAVQLLEQYVQTQPASSRASLLLAFGYIREEKYEQAQEKARESLAAEPENAYAWYLSGLSRLGLNRIREATANFEKSIALDTDFAESHYQLGLLYSRNVDTSRTALNSLEKAVSLGMASPELFTQLGFVLLKLGKDQEATVALKRAIALNADYAEAYYSLATAYRYLGREEEHREALQHFTDLKAAERERSDLEALGRTYFEDALALLRSGKNPDRAHELLQKTVKIFPDLSVAYYRLAQIDVLRGRTTEALGSIQRAIQLNPLDPEYYFVLTRCLQTSRIPDAIAAIHTAITLDPEVADFHNLLGNLLFSQSDFSGAVASYRRASGLQPANPGFHLNLSAALEKEGLLAESQKERELYLQLTGGQKP